MRYEDVEVSRNGDWVEIDDGILSKPLRFPYRKELSQHQNFVNAISIHAGHTAVAIPVHFRVFTCIFRVVELGES